MTVRDILIWPNEVLDNPSRPVGEITEEIRELANDLIDTCEQVGGVGLAAPQIGVPLQVFVLHIGRCVGGNEGYEIFINPTQIMASGKVKVEEGCLSLPGIKGKLSRHEQFGVEYTTLDGTREHIGDGGLLAQALQHEMDHLKGEMMVRKLNALKRPRVRQKMKILKRRLKSEGLTYHDVIRVREE